MNYKIWDTIKHPLAREVLSRMPIVPVPENVFLFEGLPTMMLELLNGDTINLTVLALTKDLGSMLSVHQAVETAFIIDCELHRLEKYRRFEDNADVTGFDNVYSLPITEETMGNLAFAIPSIYREGKLNHQIRNRLGNRAWDVAETLKELDAFNQERFLKKRWFIDFLVNFIN